MIVKTNWLEQFRFSYGSRKVKKGERRVGSVPNACNDQRICIDHNNSMDIGVNFGHPPPGSPTSSTLAIVAVTIDRMIWFDL
ncbi:hypothetical protein V3C99_002499 [Haemonchus contortus]